jgi:hypothetical protein
MTSCLRLSRVATVALVLVVAVAAAGCASGEHRSATTGASIAPLATPSATRVHTFVPAFPTSGRSATGSCWTTSIAVPRSGAYRCLAANKILDPCFAASRAARVVTCYSDPWSPPSLVLLKEPLPAVDGVLPPKHPWALRLGNGLRCVAVTGTVQVAGNVALTYSCGTGAAAGLSGEAAALRLAFFRSGPTAALQQLPVTDMWVG